MAHCRGGRCRIRTDCLLLCCKRASASTYRPFEGGAGPPRYAPDPGIVRTSAAGRTRTSLCHGSTALSQPIPRPRHRAAAYLRVPSVRLSSVTDFRFATAFSPCGGAGLSRLSSCRFRVCFNTEDERLPRVRIPIRFRGVSRAST